ncbi:MAG: winged helix-turn-helix transcriptional regulator [Chloroflexi bacterium]|nr:winged helix-turn-helix transcriptional regulator [Chloroflexota bacterium]
MPQILRPDIELKILRWLSGWGFSDNPFATYAAEQEPAVSLRDAFIDTGRLDWVWGTPERPQTTLFFARRGCGKTAHRRMVEMRCSPAQPASPVLSTLYNDFTFWSELASPPGPQLHIRPILKQLLQSLFDTIVKKKLPLGSWQPEHTAILKQLCQCYHPDLLQPTSLLKFIRQSSPPEQGEELSLTALRQAISESNLVAQIANFNATALFFAGLSDAQPTSYDLTNSSLRSSLSYVVRLSQALNFQTIYILVDGVDEVYLQNNWSWQEGIESLLADLPLMNMPGIAFKFFLPAEVKEDLLSKPRVRPDRLAYADLTWSERDLQQLLRQRLLIFNALGISSLADFCEPNLAKTIDSELIQAAQGIPRQMLRLGNQLLEQHVLLQNATGQIHRATWDKVLQEMANELALTGQMQLGQPQIEVNPATEIVTLGGRALSLSANELRLILCLAGNNGFATTEQIVTFVYDNPAGGVSDEAVASMVKRLRQKLDDDAKNPAYLRTEHGRGYTLLNWRRSRV